MFAWVSNLACACASKTDEIDDFDEDPLGWSRDLQQHQTGEFSMAAVQANHVMEDYSQVETGNRALFLGVYDGHRGFDASHHISRSLFQHLLSRIPGNNYNVDISEDIMRRAVSDTEKEFMSVVESGYLQNQALCRVGSCCLVGYLYSGLVLYLANLGDSRAVLGYENSDGKLSVQQLTNDHNCSNEAIRRRLMRLHSYDPKIVSKDRGVWRIKGISKVSRSIGDAFLKKLDFTSRADFPQFEKVPEPFTRSVVSAEPETHSRILQDEDKFVIFASHGFWKFMSNQKAADIVNRNPRNGSAKRLIRAALAKAAKKKGNSYKDLQKHADRRSFHDDMTVIVIFFNKIRLGQMRDVEEMSYRGFAHTVEASEFRRDNNANNP